MKIIWIIIGLVLCIGGLIPFMPPNSVAGFFLSLIGLLILAAYFPWAERLYQKIENSRWYQKIQNLSFYQRCQEKIKNSRWYKKFKSILPDEIKKKLERLERDKNKK